jgi:phytoene/squalene synthetase
MSDELQAEFADASASIMGAERAALRPLLVLAALHAKLLDRITHISARAPTARAELGPFEKLWISWRAARRAV